MARGMILKKINILGKGKKRSNCSAPFKLGYVRVRVVLQGLEIHKIGRGGGLHDLQ